MSLVAPYEHRQRSAFLVSITHVDAREVRWSLSWGWPGNHVQLSEIVRTEVATLNWLGLSKEDWRQNLVPGRAWHLAGRHAVAIYTTKGAQFLVGTDDPQGLVEAIERFRTGAA
jgi:hypothetical protein